MSNDEHVERQTSKVSCDSERGRQTDTTRRSPATVEWTVVDAALYDPGMDPNMQDVVGLSRATRYRPNWQCHLVTLAEIISTRSPSAVVWLDLNITPTIARDTSSN